MQQRSVTETPHTQPKKLHTNSKVLTASFDLDDMQKNNVHLENANCLFLIDIGRNNFNQEALSLQLSLIKKSFTSGSCFILAVDTWQSWDLIAKCFLKNKEITPEAIREAQEQAKEESKIWLDNCHDLINRELQNIPHQVSTLDDLKIDPDFNNYVNGLTSAIENNSALLDALNNSIKEYIGGLFKGATNLTAQLDFQQKIITLCKSYLIQEGAALLMTSSKLVNCQYIVYPGKVTPILRACHEYLIAPNDSEKMQWLSVKLKRVVSQENALLLNASTFFTQKNAAIKINLGAMHGKLKSSFQCLKSDREKFKQSIAQLTISVGQEAHEGERFEETVRLVNSSFKSVILMIDDSLQWRTLAIRKMHNPAEFSKMTKNDFLNLSIRLGDEWLARNEQYYSQFTIPCMLIRWCSFLNSPLFDLVIERSEEKFIQVDSYRKALLDNVDTFLERDQKQHGRLQDDMLELAKIYCLDYLKEETGVMALIWPLYGAQYEIYPSARNQAMSATYDLLIKERYPTLLKAVALRFHTRHASIDQHVFQTNKGRPFV